jgi:hypothetical protein
MNALKKLEIKEFKMIPLAKNIINLFLEIFFNCQYSKRKKEKMECLNSKMENCIL